SPTEHLAPTAQVCSHEPAGRAPPMLGSGEGSVRTGRADLEGVRGGPEQVDLVEAGGDRRTDIGDLVQADPPVGVHEDLQEGPTARRLDCHILKIRAGRGDQRLDPRGEVVVGRLPAHVGGPPLGSYLVARGAWRTRYRVGQT